MSAAADSLTIRTQAESIAALVGHHPGHPPLEQDADTVAVLLAALREGNYREAACAEAGISKHSLYRALKRADDGNEAATAFRDAVERAEGLAEAGIVKSWRKSIDSGPQYWAAAATFLERKAPERWARRTEDSGTPKVVVQIGAGSADVTVNVVTTGESGAQSGSIIDLGTSQNALTRTHATSYLDSPRVTERTLSDADAPRIKVSGAQASEQPAQASTPRDAAREPAGDPTGVAVAIRPVERRVGQRASSGARKKKASR